MTDIRAVFKVFLNFIYDKNIIPEGLADVLDKCNAKWDFRKVCKLLRFGDDFRSDAVQDAGITKYINDNAPFEHLSPELKERMRKDSIKGIIKDLQKLANDFSHNVSDYKEDNESFVCHAKFFISLFPESEQYISDIEKLTGNLSASACDGETATYNSQPGQTQASCINRTEAIGNTGKAINRIPRWAHNPGQINSRIVWSYFKAEAEYGHATKSLMCELCKKQHGLSEKSFYANYSSMTTDKGNSHGKVFEDDGENVKIWDVVKDTLLKYKSGFYK